jgi:hypothetical protein
MIIGSARKTPLALAQEACAKIKLHSGTRHLYFISRKMRKQHNLG